MDFLLIGLFTHKQTAAMLWGWAVLLLLGRRGTQMFCVCWWFPCLRSVLGQSRGCLAQRNPYDREPDVGQKW